jgi:hypothetical protein
MAGKIFINYRREQTQAEAQHLASILARRLASTASSSTSTASTASPIGCAS